MVICGNKCDLQGREVAREEGEQLAAELGVPYMETSAKDNLNVEETFGNLASRVRDCDCYPAQDSIRDSPAIKRVAKIVDRTRGGRLVSWC